MAFPEFFQQVPGITLRDKLADMLGAATDGVIEYHYADAVKLAGHSCPTVAGAWLMASCALAALYSDSLPVRGEIRVELRGAQDAGTTGVVGAVLGLITGAASEGGFKGIGGQHVRRHLLNYGVDIAAEARFTRLDSGASVLVDYHPEAVPPSPDLPPLMARVVGGVADEVECAAFGELWQARVRRILLQESDVPTLVLRVG